MIYQRIVGIPPQRIWACHSFLVGMVKPEERPPNKSFPVGLEFQYSVVG